MNKSKWAEVIRIIVAAIVSVITALSTNACTASLTISKNNRGSNQNIEQSATNKMDSTGINYNNHK